VPGSSSSTKMGVARAFGCESGNRERASEVGRTGAERGIAERSQFADTLLQAASDRSCDRSNQRPRLSQQVSQLSSLLNGFACKPPMLQRVFIAAWCTRTLRPAMHSTASLPAHRRRHTRFAGARFRPTASAREHRTGITWMVTCHLLVRAITESARVPTSQ
jgi:hypothetical protein